jgi:hypothetical protein
MSGENNCIKFKKIIPDRAWSKINAAKPLGTRCFILATNRKARTPLLVQLWDKPNLVSNEYKRYFTGDKEIRAQR